jgi:hypothetical protein
MHSSEIQLSLYTISSKRIIKKGITTKRKHSVSGSAFDFWQNCEFFDRIIEDTIRRFFEIASGSALECGAVQDVLEICGAISSDENKESKKLLDRIVAMLTKLGQGAILFHQGFQNFIDLPFGGFSFGA